MWEYLNDEEELVFVFVLMPNEFALQFGDLYVKIINLHRSNDSSFCLFNDGRTRGQENTSPTIFGLQCSLKRANLSAKFTFVRALV